MKRIGLLLLVLVSLMIGCSKDGKKQETQKGGEGVVDATAEVAIIETKFGRIVLAFFPEAAPKHVENFKKLAESGFYDSTTFHRVIPGFMIQGGDPNSKDDDRLNDGLGGPGYVLEAEFNRKPHLRGTLAMARGPQPNSAGSQFYICHQPQPHLDGQYTVFGQILSGLDVVDKIANVPRDQRNNPLESIYMTIKIITKNELSDL
jgi:peptidyl-prolyl cis-trans isomerase B (cyclophilin B)